MSTSATLYGVYQEHFERLRMNGFSGQPEALQHLRLEAMERFSQLGFPTTRLEDWRNTSVEPIVKTGFAFPDHGKLFNRDSVSTLCLPDDLSDGKVVVAINGRYEPGLAVLDGLPAGVLVGSLSAALASDSAEVLAHLGHYAAFEDQAFVALNTALLDDGIVIMVPENTAVESPIHILHIAADQGVASQSHPRALIIAGKNAQLTVVEHYFGLNGEAHFTNTVTEIAAEADSQIEYVRAVREPESSYHVATVQVHQEADSRVSLHVAAIGGGLVRADTNAALAGEGAEVNMNGLYLLRGHQHVDNHTRIDHLVPHGTSTENFKGILDGQSRAIFNGRIIVRPDAQKTDARQSNKNLMLSDKALVNTNPQLEIYADDVKCAHGSTVGQIDEEALFYFRSRGIDMNTARRLLIHGFTQEIIDMIENEGVRKMMGNLMAGWLPDGPVEH